MIFHRSFKIVVFLLWCVLNIPLTWANDQYLGSIDKTESYDIYYGGGAEGEAFIIRRVKVVRFERINDMEFLVFINDAGFNAKGKEGFVLFSKVHAIVPSSTFAISGHERTRQY